MLRYVKIALSIFCLILLSTGCKKSGSNVAGGSSAPSTPIDSGREGPLKFKPSEVTQLSFGNNKDEDPSILQGQDGYLYVYWYSSDGAGKDDIYMTRSKDGIRWSSPVAVISNPNLDLYPTVVQDRGGTFHITWFQMRSNPSNPGAALTDIWYANSTDGVNFQNEVNITNDESVYDWVPHLLIDKNQTLWVSWSSGKTGDKEIFLTRSIDQGKTWKIDDQRKMIQITNAPSTYDDFPYLYERSSGGYLLAFTRYTNIQGKQYFQNETTHNLILFSQDGINWSNQQPLSPADPQDLFVDYMPALFETFSGQLNVAWASGREHYAGDILEMNIAQNMQNPSYSRVTTDNGSDYSPRTIKTNTPGVYFKVWVSNRNSSTGLDIFYQLTN